MRLGAFELVEPLPQLDRPHAIAMLDPWIDAGSVGSLTISWLEGHFKAKELGKFARPGSFFDFTRYRPTSFYEGDQRRLDIPNVHATYTQPETGHGFLFLRLLEPNNNAESYIDSLVRFLERFKVSRYFQVGSMYDLVPHTRPLLVTGRADDKETQQKLEEMGVSSRGGRYQGPTSITTLISLRAIEMGMETASLMVHLPQYTQMDEDYSGVARIMSILGKLYNLPDDQSYLDKAQQQLEQINAAVGKDPQMKATVEELESHYDSRATRRAARETKRLSPDVEKFLSEMEKRLTDNQGN